MLFFTLVNCQSVHLNINQIEKKTKFWVHFIFYIMKFWCFFCFMNEDPRTYLGKHKSELVGHVKVAPLRQVAPDSFPDLVLVEVPAVVIIH